MTKTITVESVISNIADSGSYAVTALVNAYLGEQPVSAQMLKNIWPLGQFVDNNGRLMPLTKAAMAAFLETPEWRDHPVVQEAKKLAAENRKAESGDEQLLRDAMRDISFQQRLHIVYGRDIWVHYYTHEPMPEAMPDSKDFEAKYVKNGKLVHVARKAAERMVADGTAPTRELLGLAPVHEVRITFPTAKAAETFLRKWADDIGSGVTAALKRLVAKAA